MTDNKKPQVFHERKYLLPAIIALIVGMIVLTGTLISQQKSVAHVGYFAIILIVSIFNYNKAYITLGNNYISTGGATILFDEIVSIERNPKSLIIHYRRAGNKKKEKEAAIRLSVMQSKELKQFLNAISPLLKKKQVSK